MDIKRKEVSTTGQLTALLLQSGMVGGATDIEIRDVEFKFNALGFGLQDGVAKELNSQLEAHQPQAQIRIKKINFYNCYLNDFLFDSLTGINADIIFDACEIDRLNVSGANAIKVKFVNGTKIQIMEAKDNVRAKIELRDSQINKILFSRAVNKTEKTGEEKETFIFDELKFINCHLGKDDGSIVFRNVRFKAPLSFSRSCFYVAPKFFSATLHEDTDFMTAHFLDIKSHYAMRAYRALRLRMSNFHSDYEAQMFHSLELRARYSTYLPKGIVKIFTHPEGVETIASFVMKLLNNYGRNLWKPALWLVFLMLCFWSEYKESGSLECGKDVAGWVKVACSDYPNLIYALRNAFGPFGLILGDSEMQPKTLSVKILGFIHLLVSSVIWFIWILQIRSRFKL